MKPALTCEVCKRLQTVPADFEWDFLLDESVAVGMRGRGLRGLVWALGFLAYSSEESFMLRPARSISSRTASP